MDERRREEREKMDEREREKRAEREREKWL